LPEHIPEHIQYEMVVWSPEKTQKKQKELEILKKVTDNLVLFIMNVEALSTKRGFEQADKFLFTHRAILAVDESTTIKSRTASRTKNLIKLSKKAPYRRILTGSPVTKSPLDLFTQCEFLEDHILGHSSFWTFQNRYAKMVRRTLGSHSFNQIVGYQNLSELNGLIENFSYRVRKEECLELPDKVYQKRIVELTDKQKSIYLQMKKSALAFVESEGMISASTILTQIIRLQQVCSGYAKLDDGKTIYLTNNKMPELLSVLEETNGKVIIWANFTYDIESISAKLSDIYGSNTVASYYGATPNDERQQIVETFQDPQSELRFFVGQPRTGGYGLTLTQAHTVIYYSNGYDLEVRLQSEDRAHRIGQTNKVTYIDIIAEKTIDEKILVALRSKIDISSQILAEGYKEWII